MLVLSYWYIWCGSWYQYLRLVVCINRCISKKQYYCIGLTFTRATVELVISMWYLSSDHTRTHQLAGLDGPKSKCSCIVSQATSWEGQVGMWIRIQHSLDAVWSKCAFERCRDGEGEQEKSDVVTDLNKSSQWKSVDTQQCDLTISGLNDQTSGITLK